MEIEKNSYLTELQKSFILNNEKVHAANIVLDKIKLSVDDLTCSGNVLTEPENLCGLNILTSINGDSKCVNKETPGRENSNILSGDHSFIQEKGLKSNTVNNRYSHCNYTACRLEIFENFNTTFVDGNHRLNPEELQKPKTFRESEGITVK